MPFNNKDYAYITYVSKAAIITPIKALEERFNPLHLVAEMDKTIVGQEKVKKTLATAVLKHKLQSELDGFSNPNNILFIGPTGCGKTSTIRCLATILNMPIPIVDITGITAAGYVGLSFDTILKNIVSIVEDDLISKKQLSYNKLKHNVEHAIIYLDEIDKIRKNADNRGSEVSGECIQIELLKLLDIQEIILDPYKSNCHLVSIHSGQMLVVCGGAFSGLDAIIKKRLSKSNSIGFASTFVPENQLSLSEVTTEDLVEYGFLPEFIGRFSAIVVFDNLEVEHLIKIITEPKNSVLAYHQALFEKLNIELTIEPEAIEYIARKAIQSSTGARGLKIMLNKVLEEYYFTLAMSVAGTSVTITKEMVENTI